MSECYKDYGWRTSAAASSHEYIVPAVLRAVRSVGGGPLRILDIGCGNGALAGRLLAIGHQAVGVDLSESGVMLAKQQYPDARFEVVAADEHVLDRLAEQPFDVVVSTEVIEHVYAPRLFMKGCYTALKPGGTLVLTTPYHGYVKNLALSVFGRWDTHASPLWDGGHIKLWSRRTLGSLLTETGFVESRLCGVGRVPLLWMSMVAIAKRPPR